MKLQIINGLIFLMLLPFNVLATSELINQTAKVIEVIKAESYSYLRLDTPDIWIATTNMNIEQGRLITYSAGTEMRNYNSKTLGRTFDTIIFAQNVRLVNQGLINSQLFDKKSANTKSETDPITRPPSAKPPMLGEILPLINGETIASLYQQVSKLQNTTVKLRAKVIKVNHNIMGKNWITLQDGTGIAPDDKVIATTRQRLSSGNIVVVTAILNTHVDLGSGYKYKVLLQDAIFRIEP